MVYTVCSIILNTDRPKRMNMIKIHPRDLVFLLEERLAVYYTYESNPSDGWADEVVHNDPPEKRDEALKVWNKYSSLGVISIMGTSSKYYNDVISKLESYCQKKYLLHVIIGLQIALIIAIAVFTVFSLFELISHLNSFLRTFVFYLTFAVIGGSIIYLLIIPVLRYFKLFRNESYFNVAGKIGEHFPEIKDDLLNTMQLGFFKR